MPKIDEQIADIEKKMEQHSNRLRDLKSQATKRERKEDTRRKILYGAAYLVSLDTLSEDARRRSLTRVEAQITRLTDRQFLGLPKRAINDETSHNVEHSSNETPNLPF